MFLLAFAISCVSLQLWSYPSVAKIAKIESIRPGLPVDLPYGEVIREIRIEGNRYTDEDVIKSAIKSQVGHPYTEENAKRDLLWVYRLGSFTEVLFDTEPLTDGIALVCTVSEATPYIPALSLSLTQENGLEIGPALSSPNLFGTAARASAYLRFGGATNIGLRYADPQLPVENWMYGYRFTYFHRERANVLLGYQEKTDELFLEIGQPTSDFMRTGLRFRYLRLSADQDSITLDPDNSDEIPSLGLFVQQDSRNGIYPTDGYYIDLELSKYGLFGGDGDYWRLDLDVRRYVGVPFVGERHSLTFASFATLVNGELGKTIPVHQEFFVGGTNSVRGWSLGSHEGQNQWLNTAEYWFRLMEQKKWKFWFIKWRMGFQIGVFGDFGTAWTDYEDFEGNMISGFGAGFRLTLPVVTMFRFDLAYGEGGSSVRVFIGGAEKAHAQKNRVR
jgi:outer membrane protein assembly factor BamA